MSRLLNSRAVAEIALRHVGAYTPAHSGADPAELSVACLMLDMLVSEKVATMRAWPFVEASISFAIPASRTWDLYNTAGASLLPLGDFQYFIKAMIRTTSAATSEVELEPITRLQYDAIEDKFRPGTPDQIFVDRNPTRPQVYVWPVPADALHYLRLTFQQPPSDMSATTGSVQHGFEAAWQRYLGWQLAEDIGAGAVRKVPEAELTRFGNMAKRAKADLSFYNAHQKRVRRTAYRDL